MCYQADLFECIGGERNGLPARDARQGIECFCLIGSIFRLGATEANAIREPVEILVVICACKGNTSWTQATFSANLDYQ